MRVLFGLTVHWHSLYSSSCLRSDRELLPKADYVNSKLSVKAHRQLQGMIDVLIELQQKHYLMHAQLRQRDIVGQSAILW